MDEPQQPTPASWNESQWNMDEIFFVLSDPLRRGIVLSVAKNGPQTAESLQRCSGRKLDATLKQLALMRDSGLMVKKENAADRRKSLYAIAPGVPFTTNDSGVFIDFGFCTLRF
ncbi:MAG: helix-turn-helix transcriptional regulator [Verrucomicrobia bacterium]|nr:helix-turn-helix transcriptional regulator [Verrucomicrobiota bacterium]